MVNTQTQVFVNVKLENAYASLENYAAKSDNLDDIFTKISKRLQKDFLTHDVTTGERACLQKIKIKLQSYRSDQESPKAAALEKRIDQILLTGGVRTHFKVSAQRKTFLYSIFTVFTRMTSFLLKSVELAWDSRIVTERSEETIGSVCPSDNWFSAVAPASKQIKDKLSQKNETTKELLRQLGGEALRLTTCDGAQVDAMYLSADKFKKILKEDGGAYFATFTLDNNLSVTGLSVDRDDSDENGATVRNKLIALGLRDCGYDLKKYQGKDLIISQEASMQFALSKNKSHITNHILCSEDIRQNCLISSLVAELAIEGEKYPVTAMRSIYEVNNKILIGYGLVKFTIPSGENYYIQKEIAEEFVKEGKATKTEGEYNWNNAKKITTQEGTAAIIDNWTLNTDAAAIIPSNHQEMYAMHQTEVLALLMKGCDVMLVNTRGHGNSKENVSVQGAYHNIDAAYEFVKERRRGIPDSKIVAFGEGLNAGVAAHLAAAHPNMHLFLNQPFFDFWNVAKSKLEADLNSFFKTRISLIKPLAAIIRICVSPIFLALGRLFSPSYDMANSLAKIKGKILIMRAETDTLMMSKETTDQLKANIEYTRASFVTIPGTHGAQWEQTVLCFDENGKEIKVQDCIWFELEGTKIGIKKDQNNFKYRNKSYTCSLSYDFATQSNSHQTRMELKVWNETGDISTYTAHQVNTKELGESLGRSHLMTNVGHQHVDRFFAENNLSKPLTASR